jgi:hypothetical protein
VVSRPSIEEGRFPAGRSASGREVFEGIREVRHQRRTAHQIFNPRICFYRVRVSGATAALFLDETVIGRKYKRQGRVGKVKAAAKRPEQAEIDEEEEGETGTGGKEGGSVEGEKEGEKEGEEEDAAEEDDRTVGPSVIRNALNALVDLWNKQQSVSNGTIPSPRAHPRIREIQETLGRSEAERKRSPHYDRVEGK